MNRIFTNIGEKLGLTKDGGKILSNRHGNTGGSLRALDQKPIVRYLKS